MHSEASQYDFQTIFRQKDHLTESRVEIGGTYLYDADLTSLVTRRHAFGTKSPQLGSAISGEIDLNFFGRSATIPRNAQMNVSVRLSSADGTQKTSWIPKGTYFIDTRNKDSEEIDSNEVIAITGYDAMMRGERFWDNHPSYWNNDGKETDINVVQLAAEYYLHVQVDSRTQTIMTRNFMIPLPTQFTVRETLAIIAAMYGGSFIINDYGYLQLICIWSRGSTIVLPDEGYATQELQISPPYDECSGVRMILEDAGYSDREVDVYEGGDEYGYVFDINCAWATQAQANWLAGRMNGLVYEPFQARTAELNPAAEIGDIVEIKGHYYPFFSEEITFGPYYTVDIGAPGEEEVDHEYSYKSTSDRVYSRRLYQAEATLSIHEDDIAARVTKEGRDGTSTFWWKLEADKWEVGHGEVGQNVVFRVDSEGVYVKGSGSFSGTISGSEIYIPDEDDPNFSVSRSGYMNAKGATVEGTIKASSFLTSDGQSLATSDDLARIASYTSGGYGGSGYGGLANALSAANALNMATEEDGDASLSRLRVNYLTANNDITSLGTMYSPAITSPEFKVKVSSPYGDSYWDIKRHTHYFREEDDGTISMEYISDGEPSVDWSGGKHSFRIADTKECKRLVKAAVDSLTLAATQHSSSKVMAVVSASVSSEDPAASNTKTMNLMLRSSSEYDSSERRYDIVAKVTESSSGPSPQTVAEKVCGHYKSRTISRGYSAGDYVSHYIEASKFDGALYSRHYDSYREEYYYQYEGSNFHYDSSDRFSATLLGDSLDDVTLYEYESN